MKIIINGSETQENYTGNTLGEILDQIQKHHVMQGTILSSLTIDGEPVEFDSTTKSGATARSRDISEIGTLELEITSIQEIVTKNLNNAEDYLDRLIPGIEKAAELFQREDAIEANKFFLNIVDGMEWLSQVLDGTIKVLKLDRDRVEFSGKTLLERQTHLVQLTKQLLEANRNKDWVLVNRLGKSIISLGKYSHVQLLLRSGVAQVRLVGKWGLMNQELKLFLEP